MVNRPVPNPSMKHLIYLSASLLSACLLHAEEGKPYVLSQSEERLITAKNGEAYRVMISWPEGPPPERGYPVTYLLDGDENFLVVTSILRRLSATAKAAKQNGVEAGIIVGIGYPGESKRDYDYTPPAPAGPPETYLDGKPYRERPSGGGDRFFAFLQDELKPRIERDHKVDRNRQTLYGTGFGGLFALHVLFNHPEAFQTYIASSPSVWWNNRYILEEEKSFAARIAEKAVKARLFIAVGEFEQSLTPLEAAWPDKERDEHALKIGRRRMVDNTREMFWRLQRLEKHGLTVQYRIFPGESHVSVAPMAAGPAVQFAFPAQ